MLLELSEECYRFGSPSDGKIGGKQTLWGKLGAQPGFCTVARQPAVSPSSRIFPRLPVAPKRTRVAMVREELARSL
jgi:hypothetical protein